MGTEEITSSIEAVNQLVAMAVSRVTSLAKDQIAVEAQLQALDVAQQEAQAVQEGLGEQIDVMI